ncbi:hypothetical protein E4U41_006616 [Claviceps citrina]|nr:hypothetical protein E4U41_006616 [Claviceps citrina]
MKYDAHDSSAFVVANPTPRYAPYSSCLSFAASSSSSSVSVWSDAASQSSDDASISSANTSDSDSCDSFCFPRQAATTAAAAAAAQNVVSHRRSLQRPETEAVPAELRQNPRRSAPGSHSGRGGCPPALVRQSDRKVHFVDSLVDSATHIVEAIWPLSSAVCRPELGSKAVLPLRTFIQETLRRSRTSYSTLQVALYYLVLIRPHVPRHNFTTEQPEDRQADRALQCGRRMFLAALILASKYLQDRNYSARAWSKISGLNTQEINQNEIAFLFAVSWKLHITDDVFQRWTEIVLAHTPPPSPSTPGVVCPTYAQQTADWKQLILKLESELTNVDGLFPVTPARPSSASASSASDLCMPSPRSILNFAPEGRPSAAVSEGFEASSMGTPLSRTGNTPLVMEPRPKAACMSGRLAPALGFLPTPRFTPRTAVSCTPAVSAACQLLGKGNAMARAMAQVSSASSVQTNPDRFPYSAGPSTAGYCPARRSSLANSMSSASSPESMVSDSSRSSRSSSISSASSLASATLCHNIRSSAPLRSRVAKLWKDRASLKPSVPSVPSVPEDFDENCMAPSSPPEFYTGSEEAKLGGLTLHTPSVTRGFRLQEMVCDAASDAARALQDLHNHDMSCNATPTVTPTPTTSRKRNRGSSMDSSVLHDTVRELLIRPEASASAESAWQNDGLARSHRSQGILSDGGYLQAPKCAAALGRTVKRVCCSAEAVGGYQAGGRAAVSLREGGSWKGILN